MECLIKIFLTKLPAKYFGSIAEITTVKPIIAKCYIQCIWLESPIDEYENV